MRSKLAIAGCLLLTVIVVHTCVRIELLNARYGYYLSRIDFGDGNPKWRVSARRTLLVALDRKIANDRLSAFVAAHPNELVPKVDHFTGPPYSKTEQELIDSELADNALRGELHSWVGGMGLLQYVLAPVTLVWAVALMYFNASVSIRVASVACAVSAAASICLMFYRGYFTSLGW